MTTTKDLLNEAKQPESKDFTDALKAPGKPRSPKRPALTLIKEAIDKLSNTELKEILDYCHDARKTRKEKAEAEFKELE